MASARAVGHRRPRELGLGLEEPPLDLLRHLNLGPTAPCQSRFVGRSPAGNSTPSRLGTRPPASTVRAQAALSRLARLEDRLRGRRSARSSSATRTSSDSQLSSDAPSRTPNPPDPAQGAPGNQPRSRFLKKRDPYAETTRPAVPQRATRPSVAPPAPCGPPDSDEEEVAYLLGSLAESSEGTGPAGKPGVVSTEGLIVRTAQRGDPLTAGYPQGGDMTSAPQSSPTQGPNPAEPRVRPWRAMQPPSPMALASLPSLTSGACTPPHDASRGTPLSNLITSSRVASPQLPSEAGPSDSDSDDSHNFRVHILSLSDLHPSSPQGPAGSEAGDAPMASQVSEQLGSGSAGSSTPTANSSWAYSEDFHSTSEAPPKSRKGTPSLERVGSSDAHLQQRVVLKETAVQTPESAFAYQWLQPGGLVALGPSLGGVYLDPTPIASHVVSPEAIEVLTAYSPAAVALHDLLRQQLSLTRSYADASRELHGALLRALGPPAFRYHTLEEARQYIQHHRPARLTMEAALEEVKQELEAPGAWSDNTTSPPWPPPPTGDSLQKSLLKAKTVKPTNG